MFSTYQHKLKYDLRGLPRTPKTLLSLGKFQSLRVSLPGTRNKDHRNSVLHGMDQSNKHRSQSNKHRSPFAILSLSSIPRKATLENCPKDSCFLPNQQHLSNLGGGFQTVMVKVSHPQWDPNQEAGIKINHFSVFFTSLSPSFCNPFRSFNSFLPSLVSISPNI